ncbi:Biosis of lysosome-related organelles complex 1 subunit 2, partial [Hondaea fermentalgiana]
VSDSEQVTRQWSDSEDNVLRRISVAGCAFFSQKSVWFGILLVTGMTSFVLTILLPSIVQQAVDESSLRLASLQLSRPQANRLVMNAVVEVHDGGQSTKQLHPSAFDISADGVKIAHVSLPALSLSGVGPSRVAVTSQLEVRNQTAFSRAMTQLMVGDATWQLHGHSRLGAEIFGRWRRTFDVNINKQIYILGGMLSNAAITSLDVKDGAGNRDALNMVARLAVYSSSVVEVQDFGTLAFELSSKKTLLGQLIFDDFAVRRGANTFAPRLRFVKSADNEAETGAFLSRFLEDKDQVAELRGPFAPSGVVASVGTGAIVQAIRVAGSGDHRTSEVAILDKAATFEGFSVSTEEQAGQNRTMRGPLTIAHNPFSAPIVHRNISSQLFLEEPIAYIVSHPVLGRHVCNQTNKLAELVTMEGMYRDHPDWAPEVGFASKARRTIFLPAQPMKGQSSGPSCVFDGKAVANGADCCFATASIAAACRAEHSGAQFFNTALVSSYQLYIGDFDVAINSVQTSLAMTFTPGVSAGFLLQANLSCANIKLLAGKKSARSLSSGSLS